MAGEACAWMLGLRRPPHFGCGVKGTVVGYQHLLNPVWEEAKDPERHEFSFREPDPTVRADFRRFFPFIPKELCIAALVGGEAASPEADSDPRRRGAHDAR